MELVSFLLEPAVLGAITAIAGILALYFWPFKVNVNPKKSIVVITGCDSGFGLTLSTRLAANGYRVVSACLTQAGADHLKGTVELAVQCDITKDEQIATLAKSIEELANKNGWNLWAVVNNAGIAPLGNMDWTDMSLFRKSIEVNYYGAVLLSKACLPLLKKTKYSRIMNVSSVAGLFGSPGYGAYCGAKHALEGMMKCLRYELQPWNIRVININPSYMKTPLIANTGHNMMQEFNKAPAHIRDQYTAKDMTNAMGMVEMLQEDPIKVIYKMEKALVLKYPAFNYYVGHLALGGRFWYLVPPRIRESIDSFFMAHLPPKKEVVKQYQQKQHSD